MIRSSNKNKNRRTTLSSLAVLCLTTVLALPGNAAERVGDFSLLDQLGNHHQISWYDDHSAIAFMAYAAKDAASTAALTRFLDLQEKYAERGIQFFLIDPMGKLNRDEVAAELDANSAPIAALMDDAQVVSESLGITHTAQALLFDPKTFQLSYRGLVDASFEQALLATLNEIPMPDSYLGTTGTTINYLSSADDHAGLSYAEDIAPILADNCATCHRAGGVAPFALDSHTMVQGWSPMIREVLMTKRMPPGQVDPHVGEFSNGRTLSIPETQKLLHWIAAGSKREGNEDPLTELEWPASKWSVAGEPDLVLKVPTQSIPATGVIDYRNIDVATGLQEDRWVRASEFIPGNRTVLHHAIPNLSGNDRYDSDAIKLNRYVPGAQARIEPPNTGGLLRANSMLSVQLHYTTSGKETTDDSEIGIWFYPKDVVPQERMSSRMIGNFRNDWQDIPPYAKHFEVSNSFVMPEDSDLYRFHPHMHFRGKDLRMIAQYPDGTVEELINIANYHYAWQLTYDLVEPKFVPAGTTITSIGHFDNSTQNLANPDPSRAVPWGEQSWDEMFFGEVIWKKARR